MLFAIVP